MPVVPARCCWMASGSTRASRSRCSAKVQRSPTIEGLEVDRVGSAVQEAFVTHDGLQCGYCMPGQICSVVAMLAEADASSPAAMEPVGPAPKTSTSVSLCFVLDSFITFSLSQAVVSQPRGPCRVHEAPLPPWLCRIRRGILRRRGFPPELRHFRVPGEHGVGTSHPRSAARHRPSAQDTHIPARSTPAPPTIYLSGT